MVGPLILLGPTFHGKGRGPAKFYMRRERARERARSMGRSHLGKKQKRIIRKVKNFETRDIFSRHFRKVRKVKMNVSEFHKHEIVLSRKAWFLGWNFSEK